MSSETESSLELSSSFCLRIFKIIVIGDSGVGKTCLTHRLWSGRFPEKSEATIGVDFREKVLEVEGEWIKIQMWDTAGQERYRKSMVQHYYRGAHAIFYVYDVTDERSFQSLPVWIEECRRHSRGHDVPSVLVGNKCDLHGASRVSGDVARKFAELHGMPFFQTSAKNPQVSDNPEDILAMVAQRLKNQKPLALNPPLGTEDLCAPNTEKRGACGC
ncbi:ras-related protein Rab-33B-like [Scleropages formosus]|uniref:RAB33B, member RAS onco family n=1 Tax=Scleropages formosus TaxID=113540 RepID=A0A0P7V7M5_SCLFO|nr:ras-related protein Rab-33B-like [Scleropages formosus]KPP70899.1 ras-related protein Rab-33B-like [Scleropages formosus]